MRADLMRPVRPPDVPGVVWTIAWAFAGARLPRPVRTAVAVASVPMWVLMLLCLPGLHHGAGRRVVARLTPSHPGPRPGPPHASRCFCSWSPP